MDTGRCQLASDSRTAAELEVRRDQRQGDGLLPAGGLHQADRPIAHNDERNDRGERLTWPRRESQRVPPTTPTTARSEPTSRRRKPRRSCLMTSSRRRLGPPGGAAASHPLCYGTAATSRTISTPIPSTSARKSIRERLSSLSSWPAMTSRGCSMTSMVYLPTPPTSGIDTPATGRTASSTASRPVSWPHLPSGRA